MDTSKEYIKMCERAEKIQKKVRFKSSFSKGDGIFVTDRGELFYEKKHATGVWEPIWLPRQDQLQEMAFTNPANTINIQVNIFTNQFALSTYRPGYCATAIFDTMEQLWLAFVMKEKYGKVWDGEEWID